MSLSENDRHKNAQKVDFVSFTRYRADRVGPGNRRALRGGSDCKGLSRVLEMNWFLIRKSFHKEAPSEFRGRFFSMQSISLIAF